MRGIRFHAFFWLRPARLRSVYRVCHRCDGAYLWKHGLMKKESFIAEQGHVIGPPRKAIVTRVGPPDAMTGIKVSGQGYVLMRGQVDLPETPIK